MKHTIDMAKTWVIVRTQRAINPMWLRYAKYDGHGEWLWHGEAIECVG